MSTKKPDISPSQLDRYLKGQLDAKGMHDLEREAQNDPFLMEALEGYETTGKDQRNNLDKLKVRLGERVAPKKEDNIILWRVVPIAACLLIVIMAGLWYFKHKPVVKQYANVKPAHPQVKLPAAVQPGIADVTALPKANPVRRKKKPELAYQPVKPEVRKDTVNKTLASVNISGTPSIVYKTDTVEYKAADYKVRENQPVADILKKVPGIEVDKNGNITSQGQQVTKVRINGKDFMGGDVAQATKNLPADILEKIQVIDDYGDQANKTGIKDGDPTKVLNITTFRDSATVINSLYKDVKIPPFKTAAAFSYSFNYNTTNKIITVTCKKLIDNVTLQYVVELKDTKGIFNQSSFSVGDNYQYIDSYFMVDNVKLSLKRVHPSNGGGNGLTRVSNIWVNWGDGAPTIKVYHIGDKNIYLIQGINPFCNGHNCAGYVVYVLQTENGKGSVNSLNFSGTNYPYSFNNSYLFQDPSSTNLKLFVPKNTGAIQSNANFDIYHVGFNKLKRLK